MTWPVRRVTSLTMRAVPPAPSPLHRQMKRKRSRPWGNGEIVRAGAQPVERLADAGGGEVFLVGREACYRAIRGVDHVAGEDANLVRRIPLPPPLQHVIGQQLGGGTQVGRRRFVGEHLEVLPIAGLARDRDAGRPRFRPIGGMLARVAAGRAGTVRIAAEGRGDKNIQPHARLSVGVSVIGAGAENACRTPATGWVRSISDGERYCKVMDYLSSRAGDCQGFS
jgi:hypothetical protein